jgi:hypothetical protein
LWLAVHGRLVCSFRTVGADAGGDGCADVGEVDVGGAELGAEGGGEIATTITSAAARARAEMDFQFQHLLERQSS